ncbi:hypothetical protein AB0421_35560 [Streptomyces tsukubensis]
MQILTGGHGTDAVLGVAGAGKSRLMGACRISWGATGRADGCRAWRPRVGHDVGDGDRGHTAGPGSAVLSRGCTPSSGPVPTP